MFEEGDKCPECKMQKHMEIGTLEYPASVNCSCHISPPCAECTEKLLTCTICGWEYEE